ncbi:membrane protein [Candidatus Magnetoovum chiemensis]|nr:membrane protein [Candidatus Magnetoovum chiemensis]
MICPRCGKEINYCQGCGKSFFLSDAYGSAYKDDKSAFTKMPLKNKITLTIALIITIFFIPGVFIVKNLKNNQHIVFEMDAFSQTITLLMDIGTVYMLEVYNTGLEVYYGQIRAPESKERIKTAKEQINKKFEKFYSLQFTYKDTTSLQEVKQIDTLINASIDRFEKLLNAGDKQLLHDYITKDFKSSFEFIANSITKQVSENSYVLQNLTGLMIERSNASISMVIITQTIGIIIAIIISYVLVQTITKHR